MSKTYWQFSVCYFFTISVFALIIPFWPEYLGHLGFRPEVIGILAGLIPFGRLGIPNFISYWADSSRKYTFVLNLIALLATLCAVALACTKQVIALGIIIFIFAGFWGTQLAVLETVTAKHFLTRSNLLGRVKLWGTIGFMVTIQCYAWLQGVWGVGIFGYALAGISFCILLSNLFVPNPVMSRACAQEEGKRSIWTFILENPHAWGLLLCGFLCQASLGPYYTQFVVYLKQHHFSAGLVGMLFQFTMVLEIMAFVWMGTLIKPIGLKKAFLLSVILTGLRWFLMAACADSMVAVFFAQGLHIASFALFSNTATWLIKELFPEHQQAQAQALFIGVSYGLGSGLGCIVSGYAWAAIGGETTFYLAGCVCLVGFGIGWLLMRPAGIPEVAEGVFVK